MTIATRAISKRPAFVFLGFLFLGAALLRSQPDPRVEIINLRYHTHPFFTRIVLDIGKLREYSTGELREPDRIYVDILQAKLNPILQGQAYPIKTDYLSLIRIGQKNQSTVRVAAEINFAKVESYRVYHIYDPFRLVIDIYPKKGEAPPEDRTQRQREAPPPAPSQIPNPSSSGYTMVRQLGLGVKTIVLDPGHGGTDPGCIGRSGLQEKAVTLDLALALKKKLVEKNNLDVILTRETDIFIPLEDRTVIANQKGADLFVSIHVNASRNKMRTGIEAFYLNFSTDPAVNEIAALENATSTKNISQMKDIIQKIVRNSKIQESRELAGKIHGSLLGSLSKKFGAQRSLGVKGGPFWVLIGGEMPSVLIEVSHLSNAQDEARLKTAAYRDTIVNSLYDGIMEYIRSLGKG
ncbi:MAG: N-acetylmuramoyl-L-alanine amidase [Acidobacteriota bacterium]|nr:N-acetylmuramoyl-L-alanine amidase [Acidobacteriota bacterium]